MENENGKIGEMEKKGMEKLEMSCYVAIVLKNGLEHILIMDLLIIYMDRKDYYHVI